MLNRSSSLRIGRSEFEVIVLDPCKFYHSLTRMMLLHMNIARIRIYEEPVPAMHDLILSPSDLVIVDADLPVRFSCLKLLQGLKHASLAPLCYIPVIVTAAKPTERFVTAAAQSGAHAVLAKPFSPLGLRQRIEWALSPHHSYVIENDRHVIEGMANAIEARTKRASLPGIASLMREQGQSWSEAAAVQSMVDKIFAAGKHSI